MLLGLNLHASTQLEYYLGRLLGRWAVKVGGEIQLPSDVERLGGGYLSICLNPYVYLPWMARQFHPHFFTNLTNPLFFAPRNYTVSIPE